MDLNVDWKTFLKQHPVFSTLADAEIDQLLDEKISTERIYDNNRTVFNMGEPGNSLFLIGSGSVGISLPEADNKMIPLTTLRKGEFFGEIAVFDQKPRSATAITTDHCLLLEIEGQELLNLVNDHPEIEFKFLMHLSARMRDISDGVMAIKMHEVDEKIKAANTRLDAELKVIDASLKAAQTVFDHTSLRATEVIGSVDRSRSQMTTVASVIGGGLSTIVAVFGFIGFSELQNVNTLKTEITDMKTEISKTKTEITEIHDEAKKIAKQMTDQINVITPEIKDASELLEQVKGQIKGFQKDFFSKVLLPRYSENVVEDTDNAMKTYERILKIEDDEVTDALFVFILNRMFFHGEQTRQRDAQTLYVGFENNLTINHRQRILSLYLLLTALVLNNDTIVIRLVDEDTSLTFKNIEQELKSYLEENSESESAKLKIEEKFGIEVMKVLLEEESENKINKINKITRVWASIP